MDWIALGFIHHVGFLNPGSDYGRWMSGSVWFGFGRGSFVRPGLAPPVLSCLVYLFVHVKNSSSVIEWSCGGGHLHQYMPVKGALITITPMISPVSGISYVMSRLVFYTFTHRRI